MATTQHLQFVIDAVDKASGVFSDIGDKLEGLEKKMKPAIDASQKVGVALLGAGAAATAFGVLAVKAAADSQVAWVRVGQAAKNAGLGVDESVEAIQKFATAVQKATGYSDEYIGTLVGKFLPAAKNIAEAETMAKIALDLEAAGFANADTASRALSAARLGDIEMLRRYVPAIRGLDSDTLKLMSTEEKWKFAQKELEKQVGGMAETIGGTFAGQVNRLKQAWDDFLETVGNQVLPVLTKLATKASEFAENDLPKIIDKTKEAIEWAMKHKEVLIIIAGAILGALVPAIYSMVAAFVAASIALAPFILGGAVIAGLILGILWIVKHWDLISAKTREVWDGITEFLSGVWAAITGAIQTAWSAITGFLTATWEAMASTAQNIWNAITAFFQATWEIIINIFKFAAAVAVGAVIEFFNIFGIDIIAVMEQVKLTLQEAWEIIKIIFTTAMNIVRAIWNFTWGAITAFLAAKVEEIKIIISTLQLFWNTIWTAMKDFLAPITEAIGSILSALWEGITKVFNEASGPVSEAWSALWDAITAKMASAWEGIKNSLLSGINYIIEKINGAINAINNAAGKGASALGFTTGKIGTIPKLAGGGIVSRPTLAMIGERGPEAVIPLRAAGAGAGFGMTINITGNSFVGEEGIAEKIGKDLMKILKRNVQL